MGTIRDPSFWRRFSLAVHRQEEKDHLNHLTSSPSASSSPRNESTPPPSYTSTVGDNSHVSMRDLPDSWLEAQQRKSRLKARICWSFWVVVAMIVIGVFAGLYLSK